MKLFLLFALVLFVNAELENQKKLSGFGGFPFNNVFLKEGANDSHKNYPNNSHISNTNTNHSKIITGHPKLEKGRLSGMGRDVIVQVVEGMLLAVKPFIPKTKTDGFDTFHIKFPGEEQIEKVMAELFRHARAIYPGTKWCGDGNISDFDNDLGLFADPDACCREHDKCPTNISRGENKFGLFNNGLFTRSHCDCDTKFYECLLKNSKLSLPSLQLGVTYFNILGPQCFKEDYPIKSCFKSILTESNLTKCTEYELDSTAKPVYQWFDNKIFWGVPLSTP